MSLTLVDLNFNSSVITKTMTVQTHRCLSY